MPPGGTSGSPLAPASLIDTHVHLHDCFDVGPFFAAASRNFGRAQSELGLGAGAGGAIARVLLVMETGGPALTDRLAESQAALAGHGWHLEPAAEVGALVLRHEHEPPLHLVEGRQVVSWEGLELLATPCSSDLEGGRPLDQTIAEAEERGAIPILPWGFGKWLGRRGRVVGAVLDSRPTRRLLFADNGGRLALSWKPRLLTLAAQRGFPVVRGSDPLPIPADADRVGSSGSLVRGVFDGSRPAASVRERLGGLRETPLSFGGGVGPVAFLANQVRMQLRRRRR